MMSEHRLARRGPDAGQALSRLLTHASRDTFAAMAVMRRFAAAGLEQAAHRRKYRGNRRDRAGQGRTGQAPPEIKLPGRLHHVPGEIFPAPRKRLRVSRSSLVGRRARRRQTGRSV